MEDATTHAFGRDVDHASCRNRTTMPPMHAPLSQHANICPAQARAPLTPDEDARWARLVRAATPVLSTFFARRIGRAHADLDDLVQESLIAAYLRRGHYDPDRPFHAWLLGIARHKLLDHFRARRLHVALPLASADLAVQDFAPAIAARLDIECLLRSLPSKQANAVRDMRLVGLSSAEASALRAMSAADVRVSVHRGIRAMQQIAGLA